MRVYGRTGLPRKFVISSSKPWGRQELSGIVG